MKEKTIKDLKDRYTKAVKDNEIQFTVEGYDLLTNYCKYLLEYFDMHNIPDKTPLKTIIKKDVTK